MLVRVECVPEQRGAEDAKREEEAEGEAEEDGGEDGVGDDHGVDVPAAALLLEVPSWRIVQEDPSLDCGRDGEDEREDHHGDGDSHVDLPLPLHLRRHSCQESVSLTGRLD